MRVELTTEAGSRLGILVFGACGVPAIFGTVNEWAVTLLGVPLIAVLSAIAGIGLVVSYQKETGALRLLSTALCALVVACACAVAVLEYAKLGKGSAAFAAALASMTLQIFVPAVIERRQAIVDGLLELVYRRLGGKPKGRD